MLTATGPGVATISAEVSINGKKVTGSFPVKVLPDLTAASIQVNKKDIPEFSPEMKQYSYLMKKPADKAPVVKATASDKDIKVEIDQAEGIPGTAVISMVDYNTFDKNEYLVSFGLPSVSDEFDSDEIGSQWNWIREDAAQWSLIKKPGSLVIVSDEGDLNASTNDAKNILLQPANTDWTIETKIVCSRKPSGFSQNAGLLAYQDDDNYVKLVYRTSVGRRGFGGFGRGGEQPGAVELMVEYGGDQVSAVQIPMNDIITDANTLVLQLVKKGSTYTAYCSADGSNFEKVGEAEVLLKDIQTGIMAIDGRMPERFAGFRRFAPQNNAPETPFEVAFDYFRVENSGIK